MNIISENRIGLQKLLSGLFFTTICMLMLNGCDKPYKPVTHTIVIKGLKFLPDELTIHKGDTVKWLNKDLVMHDVTEETDQSWTSGVMKKDAVWKMAITETTDYFCSLHVIMKGKLIVE